MGGGRFVITSIVAWGNEILQPSSSFSHWHLTTIQARGWGATKTRAASHRCHSCIRGKPVANTPDIRSPSLDLDKKAAKAHLGIDLQRARGQCDGMGSSLWEERLRCHLFPIAVVAYLLW